MASKIHARLSHWWHAKDKHTTEEPGVPIAQRNLLFHTDGWGPTHRFGTHPPAQYKGPTFPNALTSPRPLHRPCIDAMNEARRHWALGEYQKARDSYKRALDDDPKNADLWFENAQLAWSKNELNTARVELEQAVNLDKSNTRSWISLCRIARQQKRIDDAYILLLKSNMSNDLNMDPPIAALCAEMRGELREKQCEIGTPAGGPGCNMTS